MITLSPTGTQIHLERGGVAAQIAQVGASLRSLTVNGTGIVPPYPLGDPTPSCSGVVLAPWPNRVRDGVWNDEGTTRALAITEPKFGNASHGLLRFTAYEVTRNAQEATLRATIVPQTGWPYEIATSVTYALTRDANGRVRHTLVAPDGRTVTLWQGEGFDNAETTDSRYAAGRSLVK